MAYNNQKGTQHTGDIQFEGDPNDTQIDFENDSCWNILAGIDLFPLFLDNN